MKKAAIFASALFLFATLSFAQEPQKPVKKEEAKTEKATPAAKSDCAKTKDCTPAKSGCCSKSKGAAPAKEDPGKK